MEGREESQLFPHLTMAWPLLEVGPMRLQIQPGAAMEPPLPSRQRNLLKVFKLYPRTLALKTKTFCNQRQRV